MASTAHQDFKGHHPEIRPHIPHRRKEVNKVTIAGEEIVYGEAGIGYVDTSGYGMLQANDAEPPPKNGILRKALQCAAVFFLSLMVLIGPTSCNKDPQPTPVGPTPIDTITPVNPGDTITPVNPGDTITPTPGGDTIVPGPGGDTIVPGGGKVVKFFYRGGDEFPLMDSVRRYANDPEYDSIYIKWMVPATGAAYWTPVGFHSARDSLSKRFNISPKIYGDGRIRPYQIVPDADSTNIGVKGMIQSDRDWYESKYYIVWPVNGDKGNKNIQPPRYNGNRIQRAGRSH